MQNKSFRMRACDGVEPFVYEWLPDLAPKAVVQIAHGMAEHAGRYARLAAALTAAGYAVYANDHRGHGRTAENAEQLGFFAERNGWCHCLVDMWRLNEHISWDHPGLPIVLLGHSMGSFMAQHFIAEHGEMLAGVILSGSGGALPPGVAIGKLLAHLERLRVGRRGKSQLVNALIVGRLNKRFRQARTPFDWLSRDEAEVDSYMADPLCGFPISVQMALDLLDGIARAATLAMQRRIPPQLSIHLIAGKLDPVSDGTRTLVLLRKAFESRGLPRVTHRFYPGARHELFNELNRDEVTRDVIAWLDALIG
jgi:alpha-beta hydrolase superfamily lysophospholipase